MTKPQSSRPLFSKSVWGWEACSHWSIRLSMAQCPWELGFFAAFLWWLHSFSGNSFAPQNLEAPVLNEHPSVLLPSALASVCEFSWPHPKEHDGLGMLNLCGYSPVLSRYCRSYLLPGGKMVICIMLLVWDLAHKVSGMFRNLDKWKRAEEDDLEVNGFSHW